MASAEAAAGTKLGPDRDWLVAQERAFRRAMDGAAIEESLGVLLQAAIEQVDGLRCAFYRLGPDGRSLHHVVGMSPAYARHVAGFVVSLDSLSCGLSVARGETVITRDVEQDPRWRPWLWMAREHDFRGCWSFPVETATGQIVGSLAMYFREPRTPNDADHARAAALSQAAAIIISRSQAEAALRDREERLRLLVAELQHRTRNLLTVVGGIADQSRASSSTVEEFAERLDHRLAALGRVQGLLSTGTLPSIGLRELIDMELSAHGIEPAAIAIDGPAVALPGDGVQLLALALHELTTNAMKHGALGAGGRLAIGWTVSGAEAGQVLDLAWREHGVPIDPAGVRRGFGRRLIEEDLPHELDAATRLAFGPDGLTCTIRVVLRASAGARRAVKPAADRPPPPARPMRAAR